MNREIKFRAWDKKNRDFDDDCLRMTLDGDRIEDDDYGNQRNKKRDVILLQYTGIKDMNGKEIYEGDIVKRHCACGNCDNCWTGEIFYRNCSLVFRDYNEEVDTPIEMYAMNGDLAQLEVLGNIYENPELLEKHE